MCSEYEPDRRLRDDQERAQEEIRRLFERYRVASHDEVVAEKTAESSEQEPVLAPQ
jgi:hypothetical protein